MRRLRARRLTARYNGADPEDDELRRETARELLGSVGEGCYLEPPFRCDYGSNISLGDRVYAISIWSFWIAPGWKLETTC